MDVLKDQRFHCLAAELTGKMVDYRARITQKGAIKDKLEERGYTIEAVPCTFHNHKGNVLMRRIIKLKAPTPEALQVAKDNIEWFDNYNKTPLTN